jgi:CheY-like chemotaxis protein
MSENGTNREIGCRHLENKRVLIAEDVELNQFLAKHILESWGVEVAIANNGKEALALLQQETFDCILMDVQMPEMDGIEATHRIRQLADPVKASIPIIALTANTLKGDSERYMAAGMNDYLGKPFDESKLFVVMLRNIHPTEPAVSKMPVAQLPAENNKLYNLSMVESISGGDGNFIKKMVALFIETVPQNVQELNNGLKNENWDLVCKMAHKLKSTIDSMGIASIHEDIRTVERNAKEKKSLQEIPVMVNTIESVINNCIQQLKTDLL